jgi:hypothetical protein
MNRAERNYCVTDQELLAVRYFVEYFRQYLLGRKFTVRSDHQALRWLFTLREPKGRIARWIEILSAYDFCIEYRKGTQHCNADGMSRCINPRECECCEVDMMEPLKCGPCKKCLKRAEEMVSMMNAESESRIEESADAQTEGVRAVKTRSASKDAETTSAVTEPHEAQASLPNEQNQPQVKTGSDWVPWKSAYSLKKLQHLQEMDEIGRAHV